MTSQTCYYLQKDIQLDTHMYKKYKQTYTQLSLILSFFFYKSCLTASVFAYNIHTCNPKEHISPTTDHTIIAIKTNGKSGFIGFSSLEQIRLSHFLLPNVRRRNTISSSGEKSVNSRFPLNVMCVCKYVLITVPSCVSTYVCIDYECNYRITRVC